VQLYVMPMAGGDALQLTKGKDGVDQFAWSPDGASIAYALADPKPELKGEEKFRTAFKVGNDDITISEAVRPGHLWLVAAQGGEPKRLTSGTWSLPSSLPPGPPPSPITWSSDGKFLVFVRQEAPSTGDQFLTRIQVLDVASGQIRSLTGNAELEGYPTLSPDGSRIAYWRPRDAHPWNYQDVWLSSFAGGAGRDISAALDRNVYLTHWSPSGDWLLVGGKAPVTDWVEMYDLSEGNVTQVASTGASPYVGDGMAVNRRQSPSSAVTKITAPTLILCDTGDFRVPIAQSFGLYRALVDNHVKTEFYAIPVGGHFPADPIRQMDVYERWQDWLMPYLK
jgi:dipeptidyl aminopeptidase/acylaminoacyl peptidase